jgi:hypothetical protein
MKRRKNPGDSTSIILLVGAAGLAYWWYTSSSTSLPAGVPSTATTYYGAGGGTAAAPKVGDAYLNSAGNVVAVYGTGGWVAYTGTAMTGPQLQQVLTNTTTAAAAGASGAANPPVVTTPPTTPTGTATATSTSGGSNATGPLKLAALQTNLQNAIAQYAPQDPSISTSGGVYSATPYVFNFYLALPATNGGSSVLTSPPDPSLVFPGLTLTNPMTLSTYWAGMSAYLAANLGMSGLRGVAQLRGLAGFGAAPRSPMFAQRGGGWRV